MRMRSQRKKSTRNVETPDGEDYAEESKGPITGLNEIIISAEVGDSPSVETPEERDMNSLEPSKHPICSDVEEDPRIIMPRSDVNDDGTNSLSGKRTAVPRDSETLSFCMCGGGLGENISEAFRSIKAMVTTAEDKDSHRHSHRQQMSTNQEPKELGSQTSIKTVTTISASSSYDTSIGYDASIGSSLCKKTFYQPTLYMRATDLFPFFEQSCQEHLQSEHAFENSDTHIYRPTPNKKLDTSTSELFIALDSSSGIPSPALQYAKDAFHQESLKFVADPNWAAQSRRIPLDNLDRILEKAASATDTDPLHLSPRDIKYLSKEILMWTLSTPRRPIAIRSLGIIEMSPSTLYDLIWDSSKTKEYNPFSCGREDLWVIEDDDDHVSMKVVRGETAIMRKTLPFITFFHGNVYDNSGGHKCIITTRTAKLVDVDGDVIDAKSFIGEIKMGTNLIMGIEGQPDKCLFMSAMDAGKSPLPHMISKRIGLASSVNFINGLREAAKKANNRSK